MTIGPFDYVNSINSKEWIVSPSLEKEYIPFLVNRAFSFYPDTVLYANEMNKCPEIPQSAQYKYLFEAIRRKKRWGSRWPKHPRAEDLKVIQKYYKYSPQKAKEALAILSQEQINILRNSLEEGGVHDRGIHRGET